MISTWRTQSAKTHAERVKTARIIVQDTYPLPELSTMICIYIKAFCNVDLNMSIPKKLIVALFWKISIYLKKSGQILESTMSNDFNTEWVKRDINFNDNKLYQINLRIVTDWRKSWINFRAIN